MSEREMTDSPAPGSKQAKEWGCWCPVLDNNHGKFAPFPPNDWWITEGCPLHDGLRLDPSEPSRADPTTERTD